jgi:hypothetical protein
MPESFYPTEDERWFFHTGRYENWPIDEAEQDIEEDLETYGDPGDENDYRPNIRIQTKPPWPEYGTAEFRDSLLLFHYTHNRPHLTDKQKARAVKLLRRKK